jgi:hypothetical protein
MKKITLFLIILIGYSTLQAQTNSIEVSSFLTPEINTNYNSNATVDIEIKIQNEGPNSIMPGDSIFIDLNIANNDSTEIYDIRKRIDMMLLPNDYYDIMLIENYTFSQDHSYLSCAAVRGTKAYPTNTTPKPSTTCVSFIVGVEEIETKVQKLYFADGNVNFEFNQKVDAIVYIHDISGKEIYNSRINKKAGQLDFAVPASGFYFLRLVESNGKTTTSKFIVSNK